MDITGRSLQGVLTLPAKETIVNLHVSSSLIVATTLSNAVYFWDVSSLRFISTLGFPSGEEKPLIDIAVAVDQPTLYFTKETSKYVFSK